MATAMSTPRTNGLPFTAAGIALHGEIITWNCSGAAIRHSELIEALRAGALDPGVVRDMLPRHAFARACRKLSEARIIRKADEDEGAIRFQFTAERKEGDHFQYDLETMLTLRKADGAIECDLPGLATLAREALDEAMGVRTAGDITAVIQRLFAKQADLFPIREQGGCYFVPERHAPFVDRIASFVGRVNGSLGRFPVPKGTGRGDASVKASVATGLEAMIREHERAVLEFGVDTRESTFERAAERIRLTRHKISAYAEYLGMEKNRLEDAVAAAQGKLRHRVAEISRGRETA
jgi:hypothetical protein